MKRWTGGVVILGLALLLILRHGLLLASTYAAASRHLSPSLPAAPPLVLSALLPSHRIPGLDDLFPARSFTALPPQLGSFNSSMAVWAHMRALLLRSDALPGTADGVLEASIAWKELVVSLGERIEDKEASFVVPDAAQLEKRSCPFSIGGNGNSVAIPCGFVEDSAVTLVGSPVGVNGSGRFWIQLAGSGLPHALPFVLHYNVSFGEDGPALAQNSRTPEKGWGVWEFCPAYGFGSIESNLKVDGLVRCNEQLAESTIAKTSNGSLPNSSKSHEPSKRSSQLSSGFPFIEGLPFTATLWAGMEGLHMTVNGRHETSFAYRERLEPWLISEVRVGGDLNLLSLLVNGLPISEDPDLVDMDILKAPPVLPKKRLLMLVGVFSTANNFKRRMALRRSWMQYEAVRLGSVAVRFLIGFHKHKQVNLELWREAQTYNDIQMMPFVDYYHLITLKTVATCILGIKILPAKYIMKTDDDAFVRIDEILSNLKKNTSKALLYGQISFESSPHRDADSKWFISPEEWPDEFYPPWAHGPGYIISRDIAKFIVQGHQERYLRLFKLEDVAMGIWIQEYSRSGHEVNYVNDDRFHNDGCEPNYILAHYQMPRLLLCLWEKLQKEQEATCCE